MHIHKLLRYIKFKNLKIIINRHVDQWDSRKPRNKKLCCAYLILKKTKTGIGEMADSANGAGKTGHLPTGNSNSAHRSMAFNLKHKTVKLIGASSKYQQMGLLRNKRL